jgi:hypothetical protein
VAFERAGTYRAYTPSAKTVGTTGEEAFLKRQDAAVAVRIGYAQADVKHQLVVVV